MTLILMEQIKIAGYSPVSAAPRKYRETDRLDHSLLTRAGIDKRPAHADVVTVPYVFEEGGRQ